MSRDLPYQLVVSQSQRITPNMQRITLQGQDLAEFKTDDEGSYVKLVFPVEGALSGDDNAKVIMRTYTIRKFNPYDLTLEIDFVLHGELGKHSGPASTWAAHTKPGETMQMFGPGKVKAASLEADWFLFAGDMTALPAISCQLEQLPENATGYAVIEINSDQDQQLLQKPEGIDILWVINPHPDIDNTVLSDAVKTLTWLTGTPSIWAACEFSNMRLLRAYFKKDKQVSRNQLYISSYWKSGQSEDKHKIIKKQDSIAEDSV
ncbi:MAG: NADPH-dependent ferric siderophore reductase [Oleispira sp.]|jgi:NADPH-dependent ferric siderophore reductase